MRTLFVLAICFAAHAAWADAVGTDPYFSKQKALQYMHLPTAESILLDDKTKAHAPILIGVIDEGDINAHHPDMVDVVLPESDTAARFWNAGHGQYVTGILAAQTGNGIGISGAIGTHVRLIYHRVLTVPDIVAAIEKMAARGVAVVNMSLGVNEPCARPDRDKCQAPIATNSLVAAAMTRAMHDAGTIFVISAGNDSRRIARLAPMDDGLIVVGGMNENHRRASYTNFGEGVSVFVPDFGIWGLTFDGYELEDPATSFTTPLVTGAAAWAALYLTAHGVKFTPRDVKSLILKSIQPEPKLAGLAEAGGSLDYLNLARRLQTLVTAPKPLNKKAQKTE